MQPTLKQTTLLQRLADDSDGIVLISFFEDLVRHYADIRNLKDASNDEIRARQLMCDLIENEVTSRLKKKSTETTITEEYD